MNRKDTIIVAVLINAGLLVILFVSALKNDTSKVALHEEKSPAVEKVAPPIKKEPVISKASTDQVDQILAQYQKKIAKESVKEVVKELPKEEKPAPVVAAKPVEIPKQEIAKEPPKKEIAKKQKEAEVSAHHDLIKVVVKKGDVLEKIAKLYGTTVGALMQENKLTDSKLQIGQVLSVPKEKEGSKQEAVAVVALEEKFYIVKNGDNLWKIAIENHIKVEDLLKLNELTEKQAKALRPGDRLRVQ